MFGEQTMNATEVGAGATGHTGFGTDEYFVPVDPMDELQCDSCQ